MQIQLSRPLAGCSEPVKLAGISINERAEPFPWHIPLFSVPRIEYHGRTALVTRVVNVRVAVFFFGLLCSTIMGNEGAPFESDS